MDSSLSRAANDVASPDASVETATGRVIEASLIVMLAAAPPLAVRGGGETFALLSVIVVGGVVVLYQRGSRAKRLTRCTWLVFFALAVATFLASRALAPVSVSGEVGRWAALVVKWALVTGLAAFAFRLVRERRAPRLRDAFDWGAVLTLGVLLVSSASFAAFGDLLAASALLAPCALVAMHFVVREQCASLNKARRFAQIAVASAVVSLAGWAFV